MKIIKNKKLLKSIGQQIDGFNTLGGGVSLVQVTTATNSDKMVVNVWAPSVSPESFQVLVEGNKLMVYSLVPATQPTDETEALYLPLFGRVIEIPFQVAVTQIEATYRNNRLKIVLPFDENRMQPRFTVDVKKA